MLVEAEAGADSFVLAPPDMSVIGETAGASIVADPEPDWPIKAPPIPGTEEEDAPAPIAVA